MQEIVVILCDMKETWRNLLIPSDANKQLVIARDIKKWKDKSKSLELGMWSGRTKLFIALFELVKVAMELGNK